MNARIFLILQALAKDKWRVSVYPDENQPPLAEGGIRLVYIGYFDVDGQRFSEQEIDEVRFHPGSSWVQIILGRR